MVEIKSLHNDGIPRALVMAKQYRLLNEPDEAESICLDILAAEPDHQEALATLLLALTDKFSESGLNPAFNQAREIVEKLGDSFCKSYYLGIIFERRAKFHLKQGGPGAGTVCHGWLIKALDCFEEAMTSCDPDNQDTVLRWNSCARAINSHPDVKSFGGDDSEPLLDAFDTPH